MRPAPLRAAILIALSFAGSVKGAPVYQVIDLGTLGGTYSYGQAINDSGEVTGSAFTTGDAAQHAFLYNGSTMVDLGTLGGTNSYGIAINASGEVAGDAETADGQFHAFFYNRSTLVDLGTLGGDMQTQGLNASGEVTGYGYTTGGQYHVFLYNGSATVDLGTLGGTNSDNAAWSINSGGEVTGSAFTTGDAAKHAFLYNGSTMIDLGTLGGTYSTGQAINDSGETTGDAETADGQFHAFLYNGSTMLDLGTFGGTTSYGLAINDSGEVTGEAEISGSLNNGHFDAFLYNGSTLVDLGTLGGNTYSHTGVSFGSTASAINASGEVVGSSDTPSEDPRAFLYDDGTLYDLNSLIDPSSPLYGNFTLEDAAGINDDGEITGTGCYSNGHCNAFLAIPESPEPATLALFAFSLASLRMVRRQRCR